jgi:hypothetical protein
VQEETITVWHVTSRAVAPRIIEEGFLGSWGDDGYGVYLFSELSDAEDYLADGGWDGESNPDAMCIIEVEAAESTLLEIEVHPEWDDPEIYENVLRYPMPDEDEAYWQPKREIMQDGPGPGPEGL